MTSKKVKFDHSIFRLVIRNIQGYGTFSTPVQGVKREPNVSPELDTLKQQVLQLLIQKQSKRKAKLLNWSVAWETHAASGLPHLDILIVYEKNFQAAYTAYDYLIKNLKIQQRDVGDDVGVGHVWITPYSSKKLSKAVLDYGQKEDPKTISNLTLETKDDITRLHKVKADPYSYLYDEMKKDPLRFSVEQYVQCHELSKIISGWSSIKTKLKDMQLAAANLQLKNKPGFKLITRDLIQSRLSPQELHTYDSWSGYQTIVDHLNQVVVDGAKRPFKTRQLLVVGPAGVGKTSLVSEPNNKAGRTPIEQLVSTYHMGMRHWFPKYQDGVYRLILWNQMKLTSYAYDFLLKFLEGSPVDLPYHGGATKKADNQLVYMTSNLPLERHICLKFWNPQDRQAARQNLSKRITQVVIPPGYNLFLLQKLFG